MQPWMNYSMNNPQMQQPMYQPYSMYGDRMNNLQQMQQQIQMPTPQMPIQQMQGMVARFVDGFENITANDVPMNVGAIFVKNDGSEIQVRQWNANGTIAKTSYLPQIDDLNAQTIKNPQEELSSQFDAFKDVLRGIENDVKALSEKIDKINRVPKAKKENVDDE